MANPRPPAVVLALGVSAFLFSMCAMVSAADNNQGSPLTIPSRSDNYPVHIGAEHHMVQGRISSEAKPGTLVPSNVIMEGEADADVRVHLRVEIRDSDYKRPHVYHPDIVINTTDPLNPQFEHPVIKFDNSSLPYGMEFVVVHTNAFYITQDRYLAVNDFGDLHDDTRIHFDVLLKDKLSEIPYVSNSLPFVVEIEYPRVETNPNAALFAGVLILTILVISLVIPFGVRAKRRHKAGKPICGCGSAEDASETDSMGSQPEFVKNRAMSLGGKDNLAMILDHHRMMNSRPSDDHLHHTIQNRMLRSESILHLQPQWLDPHLSDYYHRPDFTYLEQQRQLQLEQQQQQQQHQHKPNHSGAGKTNASSNGGLPNGKMAAQGASHAPRGGTSPTGTRSAYPPVYPNSGGNNGRFPNGLPQAVHPDILNLMHMSRTYGGSTGNLPGLSSQHASHFTPGPASPYLHSGSLSNNSINNNNNNNNNNNINGTPGGSISRASSFNSPNGTNTNGLAFFRAPRGTTSNRSSANSLYHYPANFNQGLDIPMTKLAPQNGDASASASASRGGATGDVDGGKESQDTAGGARGFNNEGFVPNNSATQASGGRPDVEDERL